MPKSIGHQKILEDILEERNLDKKTLAAMMKHSTSNTSTLFNKETYTQKMIQKVSTALGVEPSVFTITAVNGDNHGVVMQTITPSERIAELESRLRDKEEIIEGLRDKLRRYEDAQMN
jgi:aminopeptidase C